MNQQQQTLAAHESLELHEMINFKTLCLAKSKLMQGLVFDQELKDLMQKDVWQSIQAIADLQDLYAKAPFHALVPEFRPTPILNGGERHEHTSKSGVRDYAMAVTEAGTPEIKAILTRQLEEAIDTHERILTFMLDKGWYHPWHLKEQFRLDLQTMQTALDLP